MKPRVCIFVSSEEVLYDPKACSELYVTVHQLVELFTNLFEGKDEFTKNHSEIVAVVAYMLGRAVDLPPRACDLLHIAGHLHDIGKLHIPKEILRKPGPLNTDEYALVKKHPEIGAKLLSPIRIFQGRGGVLEMVLYHHERWDGKGYPKGLKGEEIPLGARILAVADAFSAMVCRRPYREPLSLEEALEEIKRHAGTQFDPLLVEVFCEIFPKVRAWAEPLVWEGMSP